jgi:hypothetical protein
MPLFPLLIWIGADENAALNTLNLDLSFARSTSRAKNPYPVPAPVATQSTQVVMERL